MIKLITFFLCVGMVAVYADSYSQNRVSVKLQNGKLTELFEEIQKQTDYSVFYSDQAIADLKVTLDVRDGKIPEILNKALLGKPLAYRLLGNQVVISKKTEKKGLFGNSLQDSIVTVRGRVYDTNEPPKGVDNVIISVKGKTPLGSTDDDGYYAVTVNSGDVLVFSKIGFVAHEQLITRSYNNLTIAINEEVSNLQEVVVTGMTEQEKQHIASAVSSVNVERQTAGKPITNLSQALQGGTTGIRVNQGSAMPGYDNAVIQIRGISTLGNANPLVIVDGVPMDMNHIDPSTIAEITVLKDAAAGATYGARGANGVILVTTKRGVPGKINVAYDGYYGVQSPTLNKLVDAPAYMRLFNEAQVNAGNQSYYSEEEIQHTIDQVDPYRYPNTDWMGLLIDKAAPITNHSLSINGGNSLARFNITGNYLKQEGMIPLSGTSRYQVRANSTVSLRDNISMQLDVFATRRDVTRSERPQGTGGNRMLEDMYRVPPTIVPKYPDQDGRSFYGRYIDIVNPLAYAEVGGIWKGEHVQSNIDVRPRWEILPGLVLRSHGHFRINSDAFRTSRDNFNFFDPFTGELAQTWGLVRDASTGRTTYYNLQTHLEYTRRFGEHNLYAMIGQSLEESNDQGFDAWSIVSGFSKLNYIYKDKYMVEAIARVDGSSRFGPGNRYGFFPSAAIGWNMHKESFMEDISFVNNLKLRSSFGLVGNENIGLYRFQTLIDNSNGVENIWGNPDITWETLESFNVGMDIGLLKDNKVELVLEWFNKKTRDILITPPVAYSGGIGISPINAGVVLNRGWEISGNYYEELNKDMRIGLSGGATYVKNEILSLQGGPYISGASIREVGSPIDGIFGYKTDGILQESDFDAEGNPLIPIYLGSQPGDIKFLDVNGDGVVNAEDQGYIGNPTPLFTYFANFNLEYKGFDFDIQFTGAGKAADRLTGMLANPMDMSFDGGVPTAYWAENYWRPDRPNARFPRATVNPGAQKFSSDFWIQNKAFTRINYIQLGYNFNERMRNALRVNRLRLYVNAQNPFVFTSMKLRDPESAGNQWTYGIMKMYSIGISAQF
ncbi:SusC/RagA family TonB-linked outer membrane protein [Olivibacter sp. SDN3]|uniref:SusC/RagA family TonB-linked outer membrane protein n=1 Tax=Olivibacter sp. SDN3 TaxID=2764720 RepID=UPI002104187B|nr:SusC/RagA family TonB-linked outer membrane protein [Olivibacter sp. SDN3]